MPKTRVTSLRRHAGFSVLPLAILLVLLILLGAGVKQYMDANNELVALETRAHTQWEQINVQLVRQYELIPKLVTVTESFASHEQDIIDKVTAARSRYLQAVPGQQPAAAGELDRAMAEWILLVEQYPNIKADQSYRDLFYELSGTKNRIAVERMRYNEAVGHYNTKKSQYPWRIAAMGKDNLEYYEAPPEQLEDIDLGSL